MNLTLKQLPNDTQKNPDDSIAPPLHRLDPLRLAALSSNSSPKPSRITRSAIPRYDSRFGTPPFMKKLIDLNGTWQLRWYDGGERGEFLPPDGEIVGLPAMGQPRRAWAQDSLVQIKCMQDIYGGSFSQGRTMRSGHSTAVLEFIGQKVQKKNGSTHVVTTLKHPSGLHCEHQLSWQGPSRDQQVMNLKERSEPAK